ncbi:MAG TPA: ABC transporter, partial [Burkholderiaceae bacterium]|nr:ABC transporter [Burkholderiaceae bacterium]
TIALSSYEGALLLVSHDRHLLRAACDQLWLVHDGRVGPFDGDLDDYAALVLASRRDRSEATADAEAPNRRGQRRQEAAERQRLTESRRPLQTRLKRVEDELAGISEQLRELDARLADPAFYHSGDDESVASTLKQRGELARRVEELETTWLAITTELEAIA